MEKDMELGSCKQKSHLLVIGKNIPYLKVIKKFFEKNNYAVVNVNSFRRAHTVLKNQRIDCILLDVYQVYNEALRFVKALKATRQADRVVKTVPIMFILEFEDKRFVHNALASGVDDYICNNQDLAIAKLRLDRLLERNYYKQMYTYLQQSTSSQPG